MGWNPPESHDPGRLRAALPAEGWAAAAAEILARHGLSAAGLAPFAGGSDVVWGTPGAVVKLTSPRWSAELAREIRWLAHLSGKTLIQTPELLGHGDIAGWPYAVMTRLGGTPLGAVWPTLDRAARLRLAADLGEMCGLLHAAPLPPNEPDWAIFLAERQAQAPEKHRPHPLGEQVPAFLAATPLPRGPIAPLHTELLGEHVHLEERAGRWRPVALLDFADSVVGEVPYEFGSLVEFVFRGEPGLLAAFLAGRGWPVEPGLSHGLLAWSLLHRFSHLPRLLVAAGDPAPRTLEETAARLFGVS